MQDVFEESAQIQRNDIHQNLKHNQIDRRMRMTRPMTACSWRSPKPRLRLRSILGDDVGAAAIEFALVFPVLLLIILGTMQVAFDVFRATLLSRSVQTAARTIQLGKASGDLTTFRNELCGSLTGVLACSDFYYIISVTDNFDDLIDTTTPPSGGLPRESLKPISIGDMSACTGVAGAFIVIRAVYVADLISPFWTADTVVLGGRRVRALTATTVIKNEPYLTATSPLPGC